MVSYSTVPAWPVLNSPPGVDQVPEFCPPRDRTNNRKVINPTPTPTKPRWLWLFQSKCVYIYPWTCENVIGIEIRNLKKLTPPGIEPRSAESSAVIIPPDHWFIPRNIINEHINLIWLLVFSHRDKTSKWRLQLFGLLDLVIFSMKSKKFILVFRIW